MDKNRFLIELSTLAQLSDEEFDQLSAAEKTFRAIWELEADVNNGGFQQYYSNSSGNTAFAVSDALEEIGAPLMAKIVADANSIFPDHAPPQDWTLREDMMQEITAQHEELLDDLTAQFFQYPEDLTALLFEYVRTHSFQIRGAAQLLASTRAD